jgi:hypothetical protein
MYVLTRDGHTLPARFMLRLLAAVVIILALLAMVQGQQHPHQFVPLPTGPMPAVLIP